MKTLLTACLISFAFALNSLAQSPAPPRTTPPGAPPVASPGAPAAASPGAPAVSPGAPAAASPGAPAAVNPAAPAQLPTSSVPPGGPAAPTAPGAVTSPAATVTATLSPAPSGGTEKPSGLSSNFLIDNFRKGGPIMWPILIVSIIGLTVVIERIFWWTGRWFRRDPKRIEKVFTAIENGDTTEASR